MAVQAKILVSAVEEEFKVSIPKLSNFYDKVSYNVLLIDIPRLRGHLKAAEIGVEEAKDWVKLDVITFTSEWDFVESLQTFH